MKGSRRRAVARLLTLAGATSLLGALPVGPAGAQAGPGTTAPTLVIPANVSALAAPAPSGGIDTGVTVSPGEVVPISAWGSASYGSDTCLAGDSGTYPVSTDPSGARTANGAACTPSTVTRSDAPDPSAPLGALIGRVDGGASWFAIPPNATLTVPGSPGTAPSRLYLAYNDDHAPDNSGAYSAMMVVPATVSARAVAVDSGVAVSPGESVVVSATGYGSYGYEGASGCTGTVWTAPDGTRYVGNPGTSTSATPCSPSTKAAGSAAPAPGLPVGSLVGRVGTSGSWFGLGSWNSFTASTGGELYLAYNDDAPTDNAGSFSVTVCPGTYVSGATSSPSGTLSLAAGPATLGPGEQVSVAWHGVTLTGADRVGIFAAGSPDSAVLDQAAVGTTSGSQSFPAPSAPGTYEARLFSNGARTITSSGFTVLPAPTLAGSGPTTTGQPITVSWSNFEPSGNDWVSLHPAGAPDSDYLAWKAVGDTSGSTTLTAPADPGSYDLRLFRNGAKVATSAPVSVVAPPCESIALSWVDPVTKAPVTSALPADGTMITLQAAVTDCHNQPVSGEHLTMAFTWPTPPNAPPLSATTTPPPTGPRGIDWQEIHTATATGTISVHVTTAGVDPATSQPWSADASIGEYAGTAGPTGGPPVLSKIDVVTAASNDPGNPVQAPVANLGNPVTFIGSGFLTGGGPIVAHFGDGDCSAASRYTDDEWGSNLTPCAVAPVSTATDSSVTVRVPKGAVAGLTLAWISNPAGTTASAEVVVRNTYVAMGDSFSSGEGAGVAPPVNEDPAGDGFPMSAFIWPDSSNSNPANTWENTPGGGTYVDNCHRSQYAYSALMSAALPQLQYRFVACSGAVMRNMAQLYDDQAYTGGVCDPPPAYAPETPCLQYSGESQLQISAVTPATALITVTASGNDLGFAPLLGYCVMHDSCQQWMYGMRNGKEDMGDNNVRALYPRLVRFYSLLRQRSDNAPVYVLGYPHLFTVGSGGGGFTDDEKAWITARQDEMDQVMAMAAARAGVHFVTVGSLFDNHGFDSNPSDWNQMWLNEFSLTRQVTDGDGTGKFAFHPDGAGHAAEAQLLIDNGITGLTPNPAPDPNSAAPQVPDHWWTLDALSPSGTGTCGLQPWCELANNNSFDLWPAPMDPTTGEIHTDWGLPDGMQVDESVADHFNHCANGYSHFSAGGGWFGVGATNWYYCGAGLDQASHPDQSGTTLAVVMDPGPAAPGTPSQTITPGDNYSETPDGATAQLSATDGSCPNCNYSVMVFSSPTYLGQTTSDANGTLSFDFVVPSGLAPGVHTLLATAQLPDGTTHTITATFNVANPPASGGSPPSTTTTTTTTTTIVPPPPPGPPPATGDTAFLERAYSVVLQRLPDPQGLASWSAALASGQVTRQQVAQALFASPEYQARWLSHAYGLLLGRAPDRAGASHFLAEKAAGFSDEELMAQMAGSAEYRAGKGRGTVAGTITALYEDLLGRAPDPAGLRHWSDVAGHQGTGAVASALLGSEEYRDRIVGSDYASFLGRPAGPGELSGWAAFLAAGASDEEVGSGIIGSQEFLTVADTAGPGA